MRWLSRSGRSGRGIDGSVSQLEGLLGAADEVGLRRWVAAAGRSLDAQRVSDLGDLAARLLGDPTVATTDRLHRLDVALNTLLRSPANGPLGSQTSSALATLLLPVVRSVEEDGVGPLAPDSRWRSRVHVLNYRGCRLADRGLFDDAMEHFTVAIGLGRDFAPAYCNRARALVELERWDEAWRDCTALRAVDPGYRVGQATVELVATLRRLKRLRPATPIAVTAEDHGWLELLRRYDRPLRPGEATQLRSAGRSSANRVAVLLEDADELSRQHHMHGRALEVLATAARLAAGATDRVRARVSLRTAEVLERDDRTAEAAEHYRATTRRVDREADADVAVRAWEGLWRCGDRSGVDGGHEDLVAALDIAEASQDVGAQVRIQRALGAIAEREGQAAQARQCYEATAALCRQAEDWAGVGMDLRRLAELASAAGEASVAREYELELSRMARELREVAQAGSSAQPRADVMIAMSALVHGLAPDTYQRRERSDPLAVAEEATRLRTAGDAAAARGLYHVAIAAFEAAGDPQSLSASLNGLGTCYLKLARDAMRRKVIDVRGRTSGTPDLAITLSGLVSSQRSARSTVSLATIALEALRGDALRFAHGASACHRWALELAKGMADPPAQACDISNLGLVEQLLGNLDTAFTYQQWALTVHMSDHDLPAAAIDLAHLETLARDLGGDDDADNWRRHREEVERAGRH